MANVGTLGIVIPTMNRPEFLIRQLAYYADVGCRYTVYVGDSSDPAELELTAQAVSRLQSRINIVHIPVPGMSASEATSHVLHLITEPYVTYIGDDDFLVPQSLEKCARFLEEHADFSTVHGVATMCGIPSDSAYGQVSGLQPYGQGQMEHGTARERLKGLLGKYYVTFFSVHRTEEFRGDVDAALEMADESFRGELLTSCLSIVRGKSKQLDCLYLVRQAKSQHGRLPDVYDWLTSPDWLPSYQTFRDLLAEALAQQDMLSTDEAREVVKEAFWSFLAGPLSRDWEATYGNGRSGRRNNLKRAAARFPAVRWLWNTMRSWNPGNHSRFTLPALLRPTSPYHADFMPIYRAMASPPAELTKSAQR